MRELGVTVDSMITAALRGQAPLASALLAQTGDVVFVPLKKPRRWRLGIVSGSAVAFLASSSDGGAEGCVAFERMAHNVEGALAWRVL